MTPFYFSAAIGCIFASAVLASLLGPEGSTVIEGVFFVVGAFLLLMAAMSFSRDSRAKRAAFEFINSQAHVFARRRRQLVLADDYGLEQTNRWEKEKRYIFSTVIPDHLAKIGHSRSAIGSLNFSPRSARPILAAIEATALREADRIPMDTFSDVASGVGYEQFCAELLRKAGWDARLTKASGDQGTDIIAERSGRRVVIQCKFYTSPVGNKAVQEVVAARLHERADKAVVVSNATYTKAARQLAGTTGVLLLHHDELTSLHNHIDERM